MSNVKNSDDQVLLLKELIYQVLSDKGLLNPIIKYGNVDPHYSGGRPKVKMDDENTMSDMPYPYIDSYTPTAEDRVVLLRSGRSYIIVGKVI